MIVAFFFSSRRRHTSCLSDWSSDVCSSDLVASEKQLVDDPEDMAIEPIGTVVTTDSFCCFIPSLGFPGAGVLRTDPVSGEDRKSRRVGKEGRSGWSS